MASCNDCGASGTMTRSSSTGNKYRCYDCDAKAEEEMGVERNVSFGLGRVDDSFKSYDLNTGWIAKLKAKCPDWPGINEAATNIRITSRSHETATMKAMSQAAGFETHFGEKGETAGGHEIDFERKSASRRVGKVSYSFIGKHRKANTCR